MTRALLLTITAVCICTASGEQWYNSHGDWNGYVTTDAITDVSCIYLMTRGVGSWASGFSGSPYLFLMFSSDKDSPGVMVDWGAYVGSSSSMSCITRLDDMSSVTYSLYPVSGGEKTVLNIGSVQATNEFYARLLAGSEFIVRFTPPGQSQLTMTFSLSGLTAISLEAGIDVDQYSSLLDAQ